MDIKLYVGNLSFSTTEEELRTLFAQAGTVQSVAIITDRDTGRSRGLGFVGMGTQAEAEDAIKKFDQMDLGGRDLRVNIARPRENRSSRDDGGGRGSY